MQIIGAGMAGLLAAHMLRRHKPVVLEAQPSLPNNHHALLRFRSDAVSRATGVPFKRVLVHKAIFYKGQLHDKADIRFSNMYSAKVSGKVMSRSILNLEPGERFIAPPDFISQMAGSLNIEYDVDFTSESIESGNTPVISTIPMPALMGMVGWKSKPTFDHQAIATLSAELSKVDVYQTLYYPGAVPYYRASVTGNLLQIEARGEDFGPHERIVEEVLGNFGINGSRVKGEVKATFQKYGKIVPISDDERKQFVLAMSDKHNIYSLGRFATWRQLLLDDVVKDVSLIDRLISERCAYASRLANSNR